MAGTPGATHRVSDAIKEWGAEGSHRIATWLGIMKVRYGTKGLVEMCGVTRKSIERLREGPDPSPRLVKAVADGLRARGIAVDLDAIAKGGRHE